MMPSNGNHDNAFFGPANVLSFSKGYNSSEFDEFCPCNQFEDGCPKICNCTDGIDDHISNCNVSDYKGKIPFFLVRIWTAMKFP